MLKKRILAIQAAVVLGVSSLAATSIPVGNIATVQAALTRKTDSWSAVRNDMGWGYYYDPGNLTVKKSEGDIKTGDTIKLEVTGAKDAAKNYKEQIEYDNYNEETHEYTTIYGVRTVNETLNITETPLAVEKIWTIDDKGVYTPVASTAFSNFVTLASDGKATFKGTGKYQVKFSKYFNGTTTFDVTDVYEDEVTETTKVTGSVGYYQDDIYDEEHFKDGWELYYYATVNPDSTTTTKELRDNTWYWNYPSNGIYLIGEEDDDDLERTVYIGETTPLVVSPYEPLNRSDVIYYNKYDPATDTTKRIMGTRTVVETLSSNNKIVWKVADGGEKIVSVTGGVVKGLASGLTDVRATLAVKRSFTITNKWEDGVTETYVANEGDKEDEGTTQETTLRTSWAEINVLNPEDYSWIDYFEKIRLGNVNTSWGSFEDEDAAEEIVVGKGESKDVAGSWGSYVPHDDTNNPYDLSSHAYYDENGKKQIITGTRTIVETKISEKHEYSSTDEKLVTVDKETGKLTGVAPGTATIKDKYTIRSTFTVTYKWSNGKNTQTITTGERIYTDTNSVKVTAVDAAEGIANGGTFTDKASKGQYTVFTKTKTATFKRPTDKNVKSYTVPATINVNGEKYTVTGIEDKAFAKLKKLKKVTVKAAIKYMGDGVFANDAKLTEVDLKAAKIDRLKDGTFTKSKKLKKLTVNGKTLSYVDEGTFVNGTKVTVTVITKAKGAKKEFQALFKDAGYTKFTIKIKKK